jgi:hypothetical protein
MTCKFCGCTDEQGCMIPMIVAGENDVLATGRELPEFYEPCCWIAPEICSAPACVAKGYEEARRFADLLIRDFFEVVA